MSSAKRRLAPASAAVALIAMTFAARDAAAQEELTLYCAPQIEWCEVMIREFQKATGIHVAMTRKSSGETFAPVKAEAANPKVDAWWGGTCDPQLQAAAEGLTEEYKSPLPDNLNPFDRLQAETPGTRARGAKPG